jgi:hypothetical protein
VANKRVDPLVKKVAVCGCVTQRVKSLITEEAIREKVTIATVFGRVLEKWGEGRMLEGEEGYRPYRHQQEAKPKREGKEYQEGGLKIGAVSESGKHKRGRY